MSWEKLSDTIAITATPAHLTLRGQQPTHAPSGHGSCRPKNPEKREVSHQHIHDGVVSLQLDLFHNLNPQSYLPDD